MNNALIKTKEFQQALIEMLLEMPESWSRVFYRDRSAIHQDAIRRLITVGVVELRIDISCEVPGFLQWSTKTETKYFECSGHDYGGAARRSSGFTGKVVSGDKLFAVRLSSDGDLARGDWRSGDREKREYVLYHLLNRDGETFVREFIADSTGESGLNTSTAQALAAQAVASVGDIINHIHVSPTSVNVVVNSGGGVEEKEKSPVERRREILKELQKTHATGKSWARLRDIANKDERIQELFPDGISNEDVRNDLSPRT